MALILADRVRDTTTTTGTGTVTLSGTAPTGYQNFSVIGNGNTTYYTINAGSEWEVGIGTYSAVGPTISRDTILESSNAGAAVNFSVGTKDVFVTYPSDKAISDGYGLLPVANGGTGVTTSTGTGSVVLNTSPTLVTPTLGVASATSLNVTTGQPVGWGNDQQKIVGVNDPSTLQFFTSNSERMRIDSSGNVGIGTSSPNAALHVAGAQVFERSGGVLTYFTNPSATSSQFGTFSLETTNAGSVLFRTRDLNGTLISNDYLIDRNTSGATSHAWRTANAERMRINSSGDVGIGTTAPTDSLDVNGKVRSRGSVGINASPPSDFWGSDGSANASLFTSYGSLGSQGSFGLDLTTNGYRNNAGTWTTLNTNGSTSAAQIRLSTGDGSIIFASDATKATGSSFAVTTRMIINASGNVGINENAPDYKLDVNGTFGFTPGASVTPVDNGDVVFELTNNTTLTIKAKGSDGVVRSGTITLA